MTPSLSVVIPSRDCLAYLPAAIDSIRRQGIEAVEIIVVDDGSSDGSGAWLAAAAAEDPRIVVLTRGGGGVAAARNAGIAVARAPVVGFLDADDVWCVADLDERLALHRDRPEIAFSFADYRHETPDGINLGDCFVFWPRFHRWLAGRQGLVPLGPAALALVFAENVVGTSTVLASRAALDALGGFSNDFKVAEDWDLWLRLARRGPVWCSTRIGMAYLVRPGSTSRNAPAVLAAMRQIMATHGADAAAIDPTVLRAVRSRIAVGEAEFARTQGRKLAACGQHLKALALTPTRRLAWAAAADAAAALGLR